MYGEEAELISSRKLDTQLFRKYQNLRSVIKRPTKVLWILRVDRQTLPVDRQILWVDKRVLRVDRRIKRRVLQVNRQVQRVDKQVLQVEKWVIIVQQEHSE